jgi:predicted Holliday junction resolvase-like endonuclease
MDVTTLLFIIIAVLLILFLLLAFYVNHLSRNFHQSHAELQQLKQYTSLQQKQLKELSHELQVMTSAAYGVGKRINQLSEQIRELDDRQEEFDLKEQGSKSIQQAIALVQKGATIEELMDSCDMSRGEAELLVMVHKPENQ